MVTIIGRFFVMHWRGSAQGSLVQRELSAQLTEGLTTPPPLRGTSPYTGEAFCALHRIVYRSAPILFVKFRFIYLLQT